MDDEVVARRPRRSGASFSASSSGTSASSASQSHAPSATDPTTYSQPRPTGGAIVRIVVEGAGVVVGAHRGERRHQPHPLLGGAGAGEVGVVLVLAHLEELGRGVVDAGWRRSRWVQSTRTAAFSATGTSNGSRSYDETHVDVVVDRLGRELDRHGRHRCGHPGDRHRGLGDSRPPRRRSGGRPRRSPRRRRGRPAPRSRGPRRRRRPGARRRGPGRPGSARARSGSRRGWRRARGPVRARRRRARGRGVR